VSAILLAIGVGWGAGNIGPVVGPLSHDFHVSFAEVGLLSGTVYFAAVMVATPLVVPLAARAGVVWSVAAGAVAMALGHALFAVAPGFVGLLAARVLVGLGCAVALIAGPVMARELGGMRLLGLFGGGITFGLAAALGIGSALQDGGVSWRVAFVISAAVCLMPLLVLPPRLDAAPTERPDKAFVWAAIRSGAVWRLLALFVAANGVPLIVGAWLVAYLTRDVKLGTAVAGALGFVVFGLTTVVRPLGARLSARRTAFGWLAAGGSLIAAGGLLALAESRALAPALLAVALMGAGFALPYAAMVDAAQQMYPGRATSTLALVQTGPNVVPIFVIPLVGSALDQGHASLALILLAVFVASAGVANVRAPAEAAVPARR
jgi:predicted MFS family arabinose efflux permease